MTVFDNIKSPEVIYKVESKHNKMLEVIKIGNTLKLRVNGIDQSVSFSSRSSERYYWGRLVEIIKEQQPEAKKVLLLGLGGGTIVHLLFRKFPDINIVSIEIDPEVIKISKKYFNADKIPNHRIINEDALRVVVEPEEHGLSPKEFDVVIVDILAGKKFPDLGKTGNFLAAVKNMTRSGGLVLFNRLYTDDHQEDVDLFQEYVSNFFKDIKEETIAGQTNSDNIIIYGSA